MISDLDILRAAQLLVKRYGADAPIVAAQRADELALERDFEGGCGVDQHPARVVEELQRMTLNVGESVN